MVRHLRLCSMCTFKTNYGIECLDATLIPDATFVVSVACEVTAFAFVGNGGVQDEPLYE